MRWTGYLEGASYVFLLAVAMPLKYALGIPEAVRFGGMAHGLLFMAYVALVVRTARRERWASVKVAAGIVAAFVPFGPFVLDEALRDGDPWR